MNKLLFLLLASAQAWGATYYVSPAGLDTNNGTSTATPWLTYTKVVATALNPGDTVLFQRGGTYYVNTTFGFGPNRSGSAGLPITYDAYGTGALPIISGGGTNTYAMGINGAAYSTFNNLVFTGSTSDAVSVYQTSNLVFNGDSFIKSGGTGINIEGTSACNNITIQNSVASFNPGLGILDACNPGTNILIQGNDASYNATTTSSYAGGIRVVSDGIGSDPQTNVSVLSNRACYNGIGSGGIANNTGNGIHVDTTGTGLVVADNYACYNAEFGIDVEWAGTAGGDIVTRNTTVGNTSTGLLLYRKSWGVNINQNTSFANGQNIAIEGQVGGDPVLMKNNVIQYNWSYQPITPFTSFIANGGGQNDVTNGLGNTYLNNCWGANGTNYFTWGVTNYSTTAALVAATSGAMSINCFAGQQI